MNFWVDYRPVKIPVATLCWEGWEGEEKYFILFSIITTVIIWPKRHLFFSELFVLCVLQLLVLIDQNSCWVSSKIFYNFWEVSILQFLRRQYVKMSVWISSAMLVITINWYCTNFSVFSTKKLKVFTTQTSYKMTVPFMSRCSNLECMMGPESLTRLNKVKLLLDK